MPKKFAGLGTKPKVENADPRAKLLLRRYFLDTYHASARGGLSTEERPTVFDACQAGGALWGQLRKEYQVRYWGVDLKPQKKGTLKIDSTRILAQPGVTFDIVDIDTFGSPWVHWLALLPHVKKPTTVFLTLGSAGGGSAGMTEIHHSAIEWLGLGALAPSVPTSLRWKLAAYGERTLLAAPYAYGLTIVEAMEATASRHARYIGVRIQPGTT